LKNQTQIALAVGAGYLLGRRRKMRLAITLGTAAATGRLGGLPGQLLRRGAKLIGSDGPLGNVSPEVTEIAGMVRGELLSAGKAAALTAVRGRLDHLSDRLHEQAEAVQQPPGDGQRLKRGGKRLKRGALAAGQEDTAGEAEDYEDAGEAEDYEGTGEAEDYEDTGEAEDYEDTGEAEDYEDTEDQASEYDEEEDEGDYAEEDEAPRAKAPVGEPAANGETRRGRRAAPVRRTRR
jgi:hypothetical protein